ncbi:MAG: FAD:protein FMN transferase [Tenericutes bacterium]|jgi:thiamine biosynthesis lipoprotein|nr:FAD:protein FMN transferase [Mycoplasmatota bacterium]
MKRIIIFFLIGLISLGQLGLMDKNIMIDVNNDLLFANPNEQYCETTRVEGVFKCSKTIFAFDTSNTVTVYMDEFDNYVLEDLFNNIETQIIEYDKLFDSYESFDGINNVYTINETDGPVVIDQKLFDAIQYALIHQDINPENDDLLFNIVLEPILAIWHDARYSSECSEGLLYDTCPIPSAETLNQNFNTNPDDVIMDEDNLSIDFSKPNMGIDLGGFAKGYISMIIQGYLNQFDISYILNLGASNVLVGGENISNPNATTFGIGLTEPDFNSLNTSAYGAAIINSSYSVVTSGSYQRYIKNLDDPDDDTIYHHIIDPRTKYPGGEALSVSIITTNTALSDILSTAIFLMDYEEALDYVNNTEDLEAIWYFNETDIRMSENADDFITLFDYEEESETNIYYLIGSGIFIAAAIGVGVFLYVRKK